MCVCVCVSVCVCVCVSLCISECLCLFVHVSCLLLCDHFSNCMQDNETSHLHGPDPSVE